MSRGKKILPVFSREPPDTDASLRGGGPLPPRPRGGSGPRPASAPAGGSSGGAGCRAGWPAPRPGCRARTGGGCRRRRSAASWGGSAAAFPGAGPWRNARVAEEDMNRPAGARFIQENTKPLILMNTAKNNTFRAFHLTEKPKSSICPTHCFSVEKSFHNLRVLRFS